MMLIAKPYEESLHRRELCLPWCKSCGKPHFYPRSACPHCWGEDYDWRPAKGTASIHSFTITRANPPTAFVKELPYVIAIVDLDEGVRMLTNIVDSDEIAIGDRVALSYLERNGSTIPVFRKQP